MRTGSSPTRPALGIAVAGLLVGLGGVMHPRADTEAEFDAALVGMFESSAWTPAHLLTLVGFAVLAISLAVLLRRQRSTWSSGMRLLVAGAAGAAAFATIESVPHLLASTEADALRSGEGSPLADLHSALQAASTVAVGATLAALAVVGTRARTLDGGRVAAALAVIGGLAFAAAGPALALTEDPGLSPLFAGAAGLAIWMVATGVRTARAATRAPQPADRERDVALA